MTEDKITKRISMYKDMLDKAVEKRKQNVSAKELAEKLGVEQTSIYRLERGVNDMKLSTFLAYLDAFDYQIDLLPKVNKSGGESNTEPTNTSSSFIEIEHTLIKPSELNRSQRLRMLQYLLRLEESYIEDNKEE